MTTPVINLGTPTNAAERPRPLQPTGLGTRNTFPSLTTARGAGPPTVPAGRAQPPPPPPGSVRGAVVDRLTGGAAGSVRDAVAGAAPPPGPNLQAWLFPDGSVRQVDANDPAAVQAARAAGASPVGQASVRDAVVAQQAGEPIPQAAVPSVRSAVDAANQGIPLGEGGLSLPGQVISGVTGTVPGLAGAGDAIAGATEAASGAVSDAAGAVRGFLAPGQVDLDIQPVPVAGVGGGGAPAAGGLGDARGVAGAPGAVQGAVVPERIGRPVLEQTGPFSVFTGALGAQDQTRQGQLRSLADLEAAARGEVTSAAELQSRRDIQRAIAGQHALAASARGGAGAQALARRQALSTAAQLTADQAGQAAILRARETDQARRTLASALGQARAQDVDVAGLGLRGAATQLGADVEVARSNQAAALQAQEANLDARLRELGINTQLLTAREKNQLLANLQAQELQTEVALRNAGLLRDDRDAILGGTAGLLQLLGLSGGASA